MLMQVYPNFLNKKVLVEDELGHHEDNPCGQCKLTDSMLNDECYGHCYCHNIWIVDKRAVYGLDIKAREEATQILVNIYNKTEYKLVKDVVGRKLTNMGIGNFKFSSLRLIIYGK